MEQYFLDRCELSLNVDKLAATRKHSTLSLETRAKMSESQFGPYHYSKLKPLNTKQ